MDGLTLQLPRYLYTENRNEEGVVTDVTYSTDKLIAWSGNGCGDAVGNWCEQICSNEIDKIEASMMRKRKPSITLPAMP